MIGETFAEKPPYSYSLPGRLLHYVIDPLNRKTEILPGPGEKIGGLVYPEGSKMAVEYDGRENIVKSTMAAKPGSGLPDLVTLYAYALSCTPSTMAVCNKPVRVIDPKGQVTDYTYNDRGQVLTETKPAATPGGVRPKVTSSYTMRTAFIKDSIGNPVAAGPPISLLMRTASCNTLASCTGTTDEVVTTYDYGPAAGLNNLNLRGVAVTAVNSAGQMETLRTCYQYNYFGEKIAETQPAANLSVCS
jgi:YD repeat-containing protein